MLQGRTAIVTGSIHGLGYAMAEKLAESGCGIMMGGIEQPDIIEAQRKALEDRYGVRVTYHGGDLTKREDCESLVDETVRLHGGVNILVNNAVYRHFAPIQDFPDECWERALAVNVTAPFRLIKRSIGHMRQAGYGRIVNISSIRAMQAVANRVDYATTKTALLGMTRAVAQEVLKENITCNAILPGSLRTPHSERGIQKLMDEKKLSRRAAEAEYLSSRQPAGRFNEVENIAALVVFLCSPAGRDISGIPIPVDAGRTAGEHTMAAAG